MGWVELGHLLRRGRGDRRRVAAITWVGLVGWDPRFASANGDRCSSSPSPRCTWSGSGSESLAQNLVTAAKVLALVGVLVVAAVAGTGAGWTGSLPGAPTGGALLGAMAVAFQAVIWSYYGYPDAAKIAEEMKDPDRSLPRVFLGGIASVSALYLLLNAAFVHVLPFERIAASTLVAGDAAAAIFGPRAGAVMSGLALLVVLASLNGNLFVTPRVIFGLSRDGLGPRVLSRVNPGGTPWTALLLVAAGLGAARCHRDLRAAALAGHHLHPGHRRVHGGGAVQAPRPPTRRAVPGAALPAASRSCSSAPTCCSSSAR